MRTIGPEKTAEMIIAACGAIIESKDLLTDVDSKIGDGDHGIGDVRWNGKSHEGAP